MPGGTERNPTLTVIHTCIYANVHGFVLTSLTMRDLSLTLDSVRPGSWAGVVSVSGFSSFPFPSRHRHLLHVDSTSTTPCYLYVICFCDAVALRGPDDDWCGFASPISDMSRPRSMTREALEVVAPSSLWENELCLCCCDMVVWLYFGHYSAGGTDEPALVVQSNVIW